MPVRKVKTAFLFFQGEQLSAIRQEVGPQASMGDAMTELSTRWRNLDDTTRSKYLQLEQHDRERFEHESAQADVVKEQEQEARRLALTIQEGEDHKSRGARRKVDDHRAEKQQQRQNRQSTRSEEVEERMAHKKQETKERQKARAEQESAVKKRHQKIDKEEAKKASQRLEYLLQQSSIFGKLKMGGDKNAASTPLPGGKGRGNGGGRGSGGRGRGNGGRGGRGGSSAASAAGSKGESVHHWERHEDDPSEDEEDDGGGQEVHTFLSQQPSCIKGGQLKSYQLEGLNWMIHLAEKGLNGILADEMGLGKTLQSISILAYHYEFLRIQGPHLVCVPKSTISNWMNELNRWCPSLRAIRFHGNKEEREALVDQYMNNEAAAHDGRRPDKTIMNEKGELIDDNTDNPRGWDVCVTTYEICNVERKVFQKFAWKYLIIDEAHRLKNDASMFSKTVRSFRTSNRLLLTGTPLQNNLRELWALLNFLLPDIFGSADQFDEWFNLEIDDEEAKKNMIAQLHKILRPFMLRRLKEDVAKGLPPKTETIIMVGMSKMQKQLYKKLLLRDLDSITGKASGKNRTAILNIVMQLRKCCGHPYLFEGVEDRALDPLGDHLVDNCGKLSMVDKLLKKLKARGSRVLIFTQMTRVLDILEDFMVMRGYQYCRIDGNTVHEDRENSIDEFNREGSEKFCFLLSTRAGGLGINLQTADVCILYDSDWNPQQDLQAQDRCHRLGQKKPVSVYRLVSENTVEEKIVERAQQKLKLDAMIVQQGRLRDKDKISKEEILEAVRFGADAVFRSEESTITDEDVDAILARGAAKTKELAEKIQKAEKGNLLDFRLDGGVSAQTFEGVDYSDKVLRDQLRLLAADSMGKRERRPPPTGYNPIMHPKKSMIVNNRRIKLPRSLRLPPMEDHHFYNRERLLDLGRLEFETYATLRELDQLPPKDFVDKQKTLLPPELAQEKLELLEEGFGHWTRTQYYKFVKACAKFGREDISSIAADMDMPEEAVAPYSAAFWKYAPTELKKDEWDRVLGSIERGEKKIAKRKKLSSLLSTFVSTFENPREEMVFANKGTTHFALEQDRALLCAVNKHGYGNWDSVREEIRRDKRLLFQHTVQGMTSDMIGKRVDYRMRQMEKECEAREKQLKLKMPPSAVAAQKAIDAIKEVEAWESEARALELQGEEPPPLENLSPDALELVEERLSERQPCIDRFREIEVQVNRCIALAEDTRKAILRGDQYVNYSSITLKAGGPTTTTGKEGVYNGVESGEIEARINAAILRIPECGQCSACTDISSRKLCLKRLEARNRLITSETKKLKDLQAKGLDKKKESKKRKAEGNVTPRKPITSLNASILSKGPPKKKAKLMMKKADGQLKPRVTSQGNKRMSIPDELFPEFCRRIGAHGTGERMNVINKFVEDHPTISVRQVTMKLGEVTTRDIPPCIPPPPKKAGRAFMFYLRPRFYHLLAPEERPEEWEKYAAIDNAKWQEEKKSQPVEKEEKEPKTNSNGKKRKISETASVAPSAATSLADGDEEDNDVGEEEGQQPEGDGEDVDEEEEDEDEEDDDGMAEEGDQQDEEEEEEDGDGDETEDDEDNDPKRPRSF